MKNTPAQLAIAMLIDLAEKGEIDPWDVQVIEVIDRFLNELSFIDVTEPGYIETNLSRSGQAFLWASMLILLKANTLAKLAETDLELEPEETIIESVPTPHGAPQHLEQHLRRRAGAPPVRKRRVTLQELIKELEEIETQLEHKKIHKKTPRLKSRRETAKMIAQLAHQENITEVAKFLQEFLVWELPKFASEKGDLDLVDLICVLKEYLTNPGGKSMGGDTHAFDRVGVFTALLLLSSQSKVELTQQVFYEDLTIKAIVEETNPMIA